MITLITGTPGAGKTLFAVSELLPTYSGRPLYVDGIPELAIPHHQPEGKIEQGLNDVDGQHFAQWLPDDAVLVVDEAQRVWRPRASSAKVPPGVAALETHRHHGQDIILITQHPNLLDGNVRRLVGRHLHVRRIWGWHKAVVYEWDAATDPSRVRSAHTKRAWSYPKRAYSLYKSATAHTSRGQRPPWLLYAAIIAPVCVVAGGYQGYQYLQSKIKPGVTPAVTSTGLVAGSQRGPEHQPGAGVGTSLLDFVPVLPSRPESAPAYSHLRQVVAMPTVAACVASRSRCTCYTGQGTRLDVADVDCRAWAESPPFNPYQQPSPPATPAPPVPVPQAPREVTQAATWEIPS